MAINQETIAVNACRATVGYVSTILTALDALEGIKEQLAGAAIDLTDHATAIEANSEIMHCDAATFKNIIDTFAPSVLTSLAALYSGSPTQQGLAAVQKARNR